MFLFFPWNRSKPWVNKAAITTVVLALKTNSCMESISFPRSFPAHDDFVHMSQRYLAKNKNNKKMLHWKNKEKYESLRY